MEIQNFIIVISYGLLCAITGASIFALVARRVDFLWFDVSKFIMWIGRLLGASFLDANTHARMLRQEDIRRAREKKLHIVLSRVPKSYVILDVTVNGETPTVKGDKIGAVYFITDGQMVKIGQSTRPDVRLRDIQTSNAKKLRLLVCIATTDASGLEKWLHTHLVREGFRHQGEWFALMHSEVSLIADWAESRVKPQGGVA